MATCLSPTFPTFDDVLKAFKKIKLPNLPTFKKPFFGTINAPEVILKHWVAEVQNLFYGGFVISILKPICDLLSIQIDSILPKIPGLGDITIMDFIKGNLTKIKNAIKRAIKNNVSAFKDLFSSPLFGKLKVPDIEIEHIIQMLFSNAIHGVIDVIISLSQPVIDFISNFDVFIAGIVIPTLPSIKTVINEISMSIKNKINSINLPGLGFIKIPTFGNIKSEAMQLVKSIPTILISIIIEFLKPIMKFVDDIKDFIGGFVIPKLCVNQSGFYLG